MAGLYFEQFEPGQRFDHLVRRTVTETDNLLFSALTMNPAALHLDAEYAKSTPYGERVVNSVFTLGLLVGLTVYDTTYGTTLGNLGWEEVKFPRPVLIGDTLHAVTMVVSKRESKSRSDAGIVIFDQRAYNQRDEEVASCRRAALMMKRLAHGAGAAPGQGSPPGLNPSSAERAAADRAVSEGAPSGGEAKA